MVLRSAPSVKWSRGTVVRASVVKSGSIDRLWGGSAGEEKAPVGEVPPMDR